MKKAILFSLVVGMILMFASLAMAKKEPGSVPQPENLTCIVGAGLVTFDWNDVTEAVKYSLDVDVEVDSDGDGENDMTVEFSVSTVESLVNIAITDFVYDIDGDGSPDQLTGPATAKVKGLDPGKGKGRQNNLFSLPCEFNLP
ncbi:MAG: hypothetical protein OEV22_20270 [Deltaproteobacteria bacterium]|nr:hypothetical protein [Deltaproteobacteria bacterium]